MCTIPSLGAKEEIKRQRIKFSDSELNLANIETNDHTLYGIFHCSLFNYDCPRTKVDLAISTNTSPGNSVTFCVERRRRKEEEEEVKQLLFLGNRS